MRGGERAFLRQHAAHDVKALHARWRRATRGIGGKMVKLTESDGLPVYWVRTKPWERSEERYYIST
ncbi:MAG: hypothetical protein P8J87_12445, partial [Verrucomicrobiales bacterium]|nr:hypothetical protein [Verrucomicrobiales bacterium]